MDGGGWQRVCVVWWLQGPYRDGLASGGTQVIYVDSGYEFIPHEVSRQLLLGAPVARLPAPPTPHCVNPGLITFLNPAGQRCPEGFVT